jgi:hypothetical protein
LGAICDQDRVQHAGNFTADQTDDLAGYKPDELASIFRWRNFFRDHKVSFSDQADASIIQQQC